MIVIIGFYFKILCQGEFYCLSDRRLTAFCEFAFAENFPLSVQFKYVSVVYIYIHNVNAIS